MNPARRLRYNIRKTERLWTQFRALRVSFLKNFHENLEDDILKRWNKLKRAQGSHRTIAEQTGLPPAMVSLVIGEMLKREKKEKK